MAINARAVWTGWMILLVMVACGCEKPASRNGPTAKPEMPGRLEAALQIMATSDRNEALSRVAKDAADLGDFSITTQALGHITDTALHDEGASSAAIKLAAAGQGTAANDVAKTIFETSLRDSTLKKIAMGQ